MKKTVLYFFLLFCAGAMFAQNRGIAYQAVLFPTVQTLPGVPNSTIPLVKTPVCLRFSILDGSGKVEYQENVSTTTDDFGMVNLYVGNATQIGGYASSFSSIVWSADRKNMKVELDMSNGCSNFEEISNVSLSSVPFAFNAITADSVTGIVAIANGGTGANTLSGALTNLGLNNVNNTSDINKPISAATQMALNTKEDASNKSTNVLADATSDVKYPSVKAIKSYLDTTVANATPADATTATNGIIRLAGDLAGTATAPTVPGLVFKEVVANKSTNVLADATSDVKYPSVKAIKSYVDTTVANATPADATAVTNGIVRLAGDLAGTAAAPTVPGLALKEVVANKSTNVLADATSDVKYPSVKSVKTYVDAQLASGSVGDNTITDAKLNGLITVPHGGTGAATLTGYVKGNGTNAMTATSTIPVGDIAGAVKSVNGNLPGTDGNVAVSLTAVFTGTLANRATVVPTPAAGTMYVVSGDSAAENGKQYIYTGSTWNQISTFDVAANDARYLALVGGTMQGNITVPTGNKIIVTDTPSSATDVVNKSYVDSKVATATPDATVSVLGKIQLAGDLAGTAIAPTVPALTWKEDVGNKSTDVASDATSDVKYPSVKSVKTYVDGKLATGSVGDNTITDAKLNGVISVPHGGTGASTLTGYVIGNGTGAMSATSKIPVGDIAGAVKTVNGNLPGTDGNVAVSLTAVFTGTLANRATVVPTPAAGTMYVVSGDSAAENGKQYIYTGSTWNQISTFDVAANDARYLALVGGTMEGNITVPTGNKIIVTDAPTAATDAVNKSYVDGIVATATPDATVSVLGKIQLAGDLAGTAAAPTVPGLALKEAVANKSTNVTADAASDVKYPSVKAIKSYVDTTVANATPADATTTANGIIRLAGDLAGTAASPTVPGLALKEDFSNKSTNVTTDAASDVKYPSVKSVKTYVDAKLAAGSVGDGTITDAKLSGVITVPHGGTGATTLTGYLKGNGTATMTASATIPVADVTGAVRSVNGNLPAADGNVAVSLSAVFTGTLADRATVVSTPAAGNMYVVSGDTAAENGKQYIYTGTAWELIAGADTATNDARYLALAGGTMAGNIIVPAGYKVTLAASPTATTDAVNKAYVDGIVTTATPDATTLVTGKIQLAGDLAGTATAPTVPGLALKEALANKSTDVAADAASDVKYPSVKSVKTYVDARLTTGSVGDGTITDAKLSGVITVPHGGTGAATLTGYVKGNGTATMTASATIPVADVAGAVRSVNGNLPGTDGNVSVSLSAVFTGTLADRATVVPTPAAGNMYVVSGDTATNNGKQFIYTGSTWEAISGMDTAAADSRYLALSGGTMAGNITVPTGNKVTIADTPIVATDAANKTYVDTAITNATPNATTTALGKIQLAGDLAGTATAPTVPGLALKEDVANKSTDGTLVSDSDVKYPTEKAVKTYVDNQLNGSYRIVGITSNVTVTIPANTAEYTILCDASIGGITVTLPAPNTFNVGKILVLKKVDTTSNIVTFSPALYMDGTNIVTETNIETAIRVQSDGLKWHIM